MTTPITSISNDVTSLQRYEIISALHKIQTYKKKKNIMIGL